MRSESYREVGTRSNCLWKQTSWNPSGIWRWKNKSCERGTKIHAEYENQFYKSEEQDLKNLDWEENLLVKKVTINLICQEECILNT